MDVLVPRAARPTRGERRVPASKSIHQRALVLAALAGAGASVEAELSVAGDDVRRLEAALAALGTWEGDALGTGRERLTLDLGAGATGFRFTLALATLRREGARTLVRGCPALLRRPHVPLRRALRRLGGHVKRRHSGALRVRGGGLAGGSLRIPATVSSQFASALMLIAPRIGGLELLLDGPVVSRPYLELTADVLGGFGVPTVVEHLDEAQGLIEVPSAPLEMTTYRVEADASCAAPWWAAAALTGGDVRVEGLARGTHQADVAMLPVLERMGARVAEESDGTVRVLGSGERLDAAGDVDLRDAPDLLPLAGALAATARGTTRFFGAGHVRFKESDRLATTAAGIQALGGRARVEDDTLVVQGGPLRAGRVDAAGDHRLVLAFGVVGLVVGDVVLRGAEAVAKSYPTFLEDLGAAHGGGS